MILYDLLNIVSCFSSSVFFASYLLYIIAFLGLFIAVRVIFELVSLRR